MTTSIKSIPATRNLRPSLQSQEPDITHIHRLVAEFIECYGSAGPVVKHINEAIEAVLNQHLDHLNMEDDSARWELKAFVNAMTHLSSTLINLDTELMQIALINKRNAA